MSDYYRLKHGENKSFALFYGFTFLFDFFRLFLFLLFILLLIIFIDLFPITIIFKENSFFDEHVFSISPTPFERVLNLAIDSDIVLHFVLLDETGVQLLDNFLLVEILGYEDELVPLVS